MACCATGCCSPASIGGFGIGKIMIAACTSVVSVCEYVACYVGVVLCACSVVLIGKVV